MRPQSISPAAVPEISGDVAGLNSAAEAFGKAAGDLETDSGAVILAWKGITSDIYNAPESPAAAQSIPMIEAPLATISANLSTMQSTLTTAATAVKELQDERTRLLTAIQNYNNAVDDYDEDDDESGSVARNLANRRSKILSEIATFRFRIATEDSSLSMTMNGIKAPAPKLPGGTIIAGQPAGNRASFYGPTASAGATAESYVDEDGVYHAGAGARAEATLFGAEAAGSWDSGMGVFSGSASLEAGASAEAVARFTAGWTTGVHGEATAEAKVGVEATAQGNYQLGLLNVGANGRAFAGAEAKANLGLDVGPDGVSARAGGSAFAGAKAEGQVAVGVSGVTGTVGADVRAGIGVNANVDATVSYKKVNVKVDVGAALGVGMGVKFDISIEPEKIVKDVTKAFGSSIGEVNKTIGDGAKFVGNAVGDGAKAVGDGAKAVGNFVKDHAPWPF